MSLPKREIVRKARADKKSWMSIENIIHVDPGNRGLAHLFECSKGELANACSHLLSDEYNLLIESQELNCD